MFEGWPKEGLPLSEGGAPIENVGRGYGEDTGGVGVVNGVFWRKQRVARYSLVEVE